MILSALSANSNAATGATAQLVGNLSAANDEKTAPDALIRRIFSALLLAPVVLAAVYYGSPYFDLLAAAATLIMLMEWKRLWRPGSGALLLVSGALYIILPMAGLVWLRDNGEWGAQWGRATVFWLFALVWSADTGAYAFGRIIGGAKLAPKISPNKTWAGLAGAVLCAAAVGAVTAYFIRAETGFSLLVLFSAFLGAVDQAGDLLESAVKRHFGVKDTGSLIPGHGGLLDRADGLLAVSAVTALISIAGKGTILSW